MKTPVIIVNFKAYKETSGSMGIRLAHVCDEVARETGKSIAIAPQHPNLALTARDVSIPILAQHVDPVGEGSYTGYISPHAVKDAGAIGSLLNHSERRIRYDTLRDTIERCKEIGLETVVCASDIEMSVKVASLGPDFVAVEPPELIGGEVSVTSARPEIVSGSVKRMKKANPNVVVLCGAGVKVGKDVSKAIELGTEGVLLASGVVKAEDPRSALLDLAEGLE